MMDIDLRLDDYADLATFDRNEWWDVCRIARPDITREQFDADWDEFQKQARLRAMQ